MTITCGTDFSEHAARASTAAAKLAHARGVPLHLVHVIESRGTVQAAADARERLHAEAITLGREHAVDVEPIIAEGVASDELLALAASARSSLIVVGATGSERLQRWLLGSVAERVCQSSTVPVLVVRDAAPIEEWIDGERTLRVMVAAEPSPSSRPPLRWALEQAELRPCDIVVAQSVWPIERHVSLGIPAPVPLDRLQPDVEATAVRDLRRWTGPLPASARILVRAGWGRVSTHLAQMAGDLAADVVVVGTHQRAALARLWQGSVSRAALHELTTNVVCVPSPSTSEEDAELPSLQTILAATDFSRAGNRAIPYAYSIVGSGGHVRLLHVLTSTESPDAVSSATARLRALAPAAAAPRGIETSIEVVTAASAAEGILQYAARSGVDAICMGTHGQSRMRRLLLGSQASETLSKSDRPVVLVPAHPDDLA